jgi:class 3 adenylate cyclase
LRYRFGEYEVDAGRFVLLRAGSPVPIEPRPLALLIHLLERHPSVVSRDELLARLWPDAVVLEGSLSRAVREIRRALRESADRDGVIRTVRGRGYAIGVGIERAGDAADRPTPSPLRSGGSATLEPLESSAAPRRSMAILSADLAGFSEHRAHDAEGTVARLAALRPVAVEIFGRHRGLLAQFVADNLLAVFPSAVEAARAALAFRDSVARGDPLRGDAEPLAFRIGLHLADVIEDDGRFYGGGIQIAARLERLAEPGGLCLSAAIRDQIAGRMPLDLEDLGEQSLKGAAEPIRVYRLGPHGQATASRS